MKRYGLPSAAASGIVGFCRKVKMLLELREGVIPNQGPEDRAVLVGDLRAWGHGTGEYPAAEEHFVDALSMAARGTADPALAALAGAGGSGSGILARQFASGAEQELYFGFRVPAGFYEHSDVRVHALWCPTDEAHGDVAWGLEYSKAGPGGAFPATSSMAGIGRAGGAAALAARTLVGAVPGSGLARGSAVACRVYRASGHASDTYGSPAALLGLVFQCPANAGGKAV